ncbi:MAG: type II secretion system protein [Polyangiaceae bacterium]
MAPERATRNRLQAPPLPSPLAHQPGVRKRRSLGSLAGFTLVEMMIVVAIIATCAALATPSIMRIMRDRRSQRNALAALVMIQDAHTRAMGRGAAVRLQWTPAIAGSTPAVLAIQEASVDIDGNGTADFPSPLCRATFSPTIKFWQTDAEDDTHVEVNLNGHGGVFASTSSEQFCFTPRGKTMYWNGTQWEPLTTHVTLTFASHMDSGTSDTDADNRRNVDFFPNGMSRLRL